MTKIKIFTLLSILFFYIFWGRVMADSNSEYLKLTLIYNNQKKIIKVVLKNISDQPVKVNKKMSIGPVFGPLNELAFEVLDENNRKFPLRSKLRVMRAKEKDIYTLKSKEEIFRDLDIAYLVKLYGLAPGAYILRTNYQNRTLDNVNNEILWSEPINMTVDSKQ